MSATSPAPTRAALRHDPRTAVLAALIMTMALAAVDSTVVTTAVPSVVRDLGGFSLFPWLFSIYLLTQAVTIPVYGRMADVFGRRPVLYLGVGLFLAGSIACGLAWNMVSLIAFRGLQGLGAGAIQPTVMVVLGDLYDVRERAKVQGYLASVWGISSVVGPLIGGALSEFASWRWIFYVNVPIGIVAIALLARYLHETVARRAEKIDYLGTAVLTAGLVCLILGLLQGGTTWPWSSPPELGLFGAAAALLGCFGVIEHRASAPMMPPWIVSRRPLLAGNLANVVIGAVLLGLTSYVPTFEQGVHRLSPLVAGLTVAAVTLGWPIAAGYSGRLYLRYGFRASALAGGALSLVGALLFASVTRTTPVEVVAAYGFVIGLGLGLVATPVLVALQSLVGWERRGVVTASNMFARSIGSAVGIAVLGSLANSSLASWLRAAPPAVKHLLPDSVNVASRVLGGGKVTLAPAAASYVRAGIFHATHAVFLGLVGIAVLGVLALAAVPRRLEPLVFSDDPPGEDRAGRISEAVGSDAVGQP